jgi:hypothetical protein
VLAVVLIVELLAALVLVSPVAVAPGAGGGAASATSSTPSVGARTPSAPSTLVLGDGRTVHLLGLGGASTQVLLARVAAQVGAAVEAVVQFWGADWQRDIVIVATGSDEQFRQLTGGPAGVQWVDVAAAAVADRVDPDRRTATGQRVVFAPGAAAMSDYALKIVLRHELFHFASRAETALDAPRWLVEGVADFVGRPPTPRPGPASAAALATLPPDADFDTSGAAQSLAYDRAWWFTRFVADTYGTATLRALYLCAGGTGHPDAATAIQQLLGAQQADVLSHWRRWLAG